MREAAILNLKFDALADGKPVDPVYSVQLVVSMRKTFAGYLNEVKLFFRKTSF